MKACRLCCFLFLGMLLDGECDSDLALLDEEVDLSLAKHWCSSCRQFCELCH